jgi:ATP/maltotriose-dependent transcriptional regulator MalT
MNDEGKPSFHSSLITPHSSFIISINTLRNHIRSIYDKLHVHSKAEAVSKALRFRLIS